MKKAFKKAGDIKIGVIGYGGAFNMGRHHIKEMQAAGMTPVAVSEIDPKRLEVATTDFPGIETYSSVAEMLRKSSVQLVTIITPHNTHAPLALQCLRAGRHVVCEKPLAITTEECNSMIAEARRQKVVLSTYHNRHWEGAIQLALKVIRKGTIGKVFRVEAHMGGYGQPGDMWRSNRKISGGILYDWGVHLLEYSLQVIDSDVVEVSGFANSGFWAPKIKWKKDSNEDEGFAVIRFKNGSWLTLCISHLQSNPKRGRVEFMGTKGNFLMISDREYEITTHQGGETIVTKGMSEPSDWRRFYENIAGHLVKGTKLIITPEWARRPIHILDLASRSARLGRTLPARYG